MLPQSNALYSLRPGPSLYPLITKALWHTCCCGLLPCRSHARPPLLSPHSTSYTQTNNYHHPPLDLCDQCSSPTAPKLGVCKVVSFLMVQADFWVKA